jgi:hypothetical protein
MCDLCSSDIDIMEKATLHEYRIAQDLLSLSKSLKALACGRIKPHSNQAENIGILARSVIKDLVADWI